MLRQSRCFDGRPCAGGGLCAIPVVQFDADERGKSDGHLARDTVHLLCMDVRTLLAGGDIDSNGVRGPGCGAHLLCDDATEE